ncbi:MAG: ABC transporter permease, partial [Candidatus Cyclobacteriaceae bacterium M3_2C_046]
MILHYLKLAWRNLMRNKLFSFINIFGLSLSISLGIFILAMLSSQLKYDSFHKNKEEIYRLTSSKEGYNNYFATTPEAAAKNLSEIAGVKKTGRLIVGLGGDMIYNQKSTECTGFFADPEILQIFDFPLAKGNPDYALQDPYSMVISNQLAKKLFGQEDPLGKMITFEEMGLHRFEMG